MKNIAQAFSYQFQDQNWLKKILLGTLVSISCIFVIPIPILIGYYLELQRNVMDKKKDLMPEWNNMGAYFMDGLKFMLVMIGYSLPLILVVILMTIISIVAFFIDEDLFGILVVFFMFAFQALVMVYALAMALITPVVYIKAAQRKPWKEFYNFKEIWKFVKNNFALILIIIVINWACGFIVNFSLLFFIVGIFPASFYVGTVIAYLYGQLYLQAKE